MQLLKLRYFQLKRDLGYWIPVITLVIFGISKAIAEFSAAYAGVLCFVFLFILQHYHTNRKDLNFITKYLGHAQREIVITYSLLTIPVSSALVVTGHYGLAIITQLGAASLPFINIKTRTLTVLFLGKCLPPEQFEWIAGIRRNFFVLVILVLLAVFFSPVKFFALVSLFLLNVVILGFYNSYEPLVMLNPDHLGGKQFLYKKITFLHKALLVCNFPLLLVNTLFHPDIFWYNVCFLAAVLILASYTVYCKYAYYTPNRQPPFLIDSLFIFSSVLIPFLIPVSLVLNTRYRKKALQNLANYTDDYC